MHIDAGLSKGERPQQTLSTASLAFFRVRVVDAGSSCSFPCTSGLLSASSALSMSCLRACEEQRLVVVGQTLHLTVQWTIS